MKLKDSFIITVQDGTQILIDSSTGFKGMIKNNPTAAYIVECLKEECDIDSIVEKMSERYDVERDILYNDVIKTVEALKRAGAIDE